MKEKYIWFSVLFFILLYLGKICLDFVSEDSNSSRKLIEIKLEIENEIIDIGKNKIANESKAIYKLTNKSETDIQIKNIVSDCHCTIVKWDSTSIKPSKSFEIQLTYDNNTEGFFEQTATISFKNSKFKQLLVMRGNITK